MSQVDSGLRAGVLPGMPGPHWSQEPLPTLDESESVMRRNQTTGRPDSRIDDRIVLSGLWTSVLFIFAYVDIFGFWRADILRGALDGRVSGTAVAINQTFLALTTAYILVPSLMIVVSLLARARVNRAANIVISVLYFVSIVVTALGERWTYYLVGSAVELLLLLMIGRTAWIWRQRSHPALPLASSSETPAT